jgi:hypothetical protein
MKRYSMGGVMWFRKVCTTQTEWGEEIGKIWMDSKWFGYWREILYEGEREEEGWFGSERGFQTMDDVREDGIGWFVSW